MDPARFSITQTADSSMKKVICNRRRKDIPVRVTVGLGGGQTVTVMQWITVTFFQEEHTSAALKTYQNSKINKEVQTNQVIDA